MITLNGQELQKYGITVRAQTTLGIWGSQKPIIIETPVQLRGGRIDIGEIGAYSYFGQGRSILQHIGKIGRFCAFGPDVVTGYTEHTTQALSPHPVFYWEKFDENWEQAKPLYENGEFLRKLNNSKNAQIEKQARIEIGNDVWVGNGVYISRGVKIGDGAVIAARAVVTRDVPPYTIVGGIPAKPIRQRFSDAIVEKLLKLQWWEYGPTVLKNIDITDINIALPQIESRIASGFSRHICNKLEINTISNTLIFHPTTGNSQEIVI